MIAPVPRFEESRKFAPVVRRDLPLARVELLVQTGRKMTPRRVMKNLRSPETRQRVFSSASLRELSHRPLIDVPGQR